MSITSLICDPEGVLVGGCLGEYFCTLTHQGSNHRYDAMCISSKCFIIYVGDDVPTDSVMSTVTLIILKLCNLTFSK
jgi:hypothetical protein